MSDPIDQASARYDQVEQAYIHAIASGQDDAALRRLAREVATAAEAWESAGNAEGPPPGGLTRYYDVPEVLSTLWRDVAAAYERREP